MKLIEVESGKLSANVDDLQREIVSLRKTLHTAQQAKVDTESAWGGAARVKSHIDDAWLSVCVLRVIVFCHMCA